MAQTPGSRTHGGLEGECRFACLGGWRAGRPRGARLCYRQPLGFLPLHYCLHSSSSTFHSGEFLRPPPPERRLERTQHRTSAT